MTIYVWMVVLLVAAAFLFRGNRRNCKIFMIISFLLLFSVMGLRNVYAFGSDAWGTHGSYSMNFDRIGATPWGNLAGKGQNNYNIGFIYLMKIFYELTNGNYQLFISIFSLFVVFSYVRFIKKYSVSPIQSVLYFLGLLFYPFLFDALKQALAMAVLLFAFDAIIEKKPIKFLIIVALAATFHFPALVFLPAYWIGRMKIGRNYLILLAAFLLITFVFRNQLLNLMLNAYGDNDTEATMEGIRFLRNKALIMIAIVIFAVVIRPPTPEETVYNTLLMFAGISIVFQTFCGYNNIFERLADYYFHTSIVFIPLVFEQGREPSGRIALFVSDPVKKAAVLIACAFAIWRFLSYVNDSGLFLPYLFFWQS